MLTRDRFEKMDEATLCAEVIIPLLAKLGYKDVTEYHGGAGELGKDIVCWKTDELGSRVNLAIVAKAVRMNGKAKADIGSAGEVQTQIRQCFGGSYRDPITGTEQKVDVVWVMNNHEISKESVAAISSALGASELRTVRFIGRDTLWEQVEKHLPVSVLAHAQVLQKQVEGIDPHYKPVITVSDDKILVSLEEKYPGAAEENPIEFTTTFKDEEAAASFQEILRRYRETGETAEIPSELIESVDLPDFTRTMFGVQAGSTTMTLIPAPNPIEFPIRFRVLCDDGDEYSRDYIVLRAQGGTKQATLTSDERDVPFRLTIRLALKKGEEAFTESDFTVQPRKAPYNAVQQWEWLRLNTCLSKPCRIQVDSVENGFNFFEGRSHIGGTTTPPVEIVKFYECLAVIQQKFRRPILIPQRDFITREEIDLVEELHQIVTVGRIEGTWSNFTANFRLLPGVTASEFFANLQASFSQDRPAFFVQEQEESMTLFEVELPLGRVRKTVHNVVVTGVEETHKDDSEVQVEAMLLKANFEAFGEAIVVMEYIDWLHDGSKPLPLLQEMNSVKIVD